MTLVVAQRTPMVSFLGAPRRAPSLPALLHAKVRTNLAIPRGLTARRYQEEDKETNSNKATTQTSRRGNQVVVAVDNSDSAHNALKWALDNLVRPGDCVHLLHVLPDLHSRPAGGSTIYAPPPMPELVMEVKQTAREFLTEKFVPEVQRSGRHASVEVDLVQAEGSWSLADVLCTKASDLSASVLVLGSHHKGLLAEILTGGSVAPQVVSKAEMPVVVVH